MKRTKRTYRLTVLLLCALTLFCTLGGCRQKDLPLTTIATPDGIEDLPLVTMLIDPGFAVETDNFRRFLQTVPGHDQEFHVEFERLDGRSTQRNQNLQRIRTEILAGKGPDIFFCECVFNSTMTPYGEETEWEKGALFNFPQQAMKRRMFLPLDPYIENAQFMEFDKLNQTIMAAGRNEEGQQLLPMTFDFGAAFYVPSGENGFLKPPKNRREMLESGLPVLEFNAKGSWGYDLLNIFPQVIDWERELPAFTEEELLARALEYWESKNTDWGYEKGWYYKPYASEAEWSSRAEDSMSISEFLGETQPREDAVMVPEYNYHDGVTAYVRNFVAISRNASYPDYAFRIVDKLLSRSTMDERQIYRTMVKGIPVYTGASPEDAVALAYTLSQERFEEYQAMLGLVDNVRFYSTLDQEMLRTVKPVCETEGATKEDVEKAVHKAYLAMKMMLGES